jgi:hypothetical protein
MVRRSSPHFSFHASLRLQFFNSQRNYSRAMRHILQDAKHRQRVRHHLLGLVFRFRLCSPLALPLDNHLLYSCARTTSKTRFPRRPWSKPRGWVPGRRASPKRTRWAQKAPTSPHRLGQPCVSPSPPPPFPSQTANEEMIDQVILDNFELRGSTKPPSIYDVLWVQLLLRSERQRTASA